MKPKKQEKQFKTVLDLPFDESVKRLSAVVDDVYKIINNPKFVAAVEDNIKLPANATQRDIEKVWQSKAVADKVKGFIQVFLREETESVLNILATLFCEDKAVYRQKSLTEILQDLDDFTKSGQVGRVVSFFTPAR